MTGGQPGLSDDDNIQARPTVTLLRDFDPCFDQVKEEEGDSHGNEEDDEATEVEELYDQIDEITISGQTEVVMDSPPKAKPRKKFPIGSPKKINFGPPKPPRNFNYSSTTKDEESKTKDIRDLSSRLKTMLSESNLVRAIKKSDVEATEKAAGDDHRAEKELCARQRNTAASENIYVTVPFLPSEEDETTPPPLPTCPPPARVKERAVTMYENVWVEPPAGPPLPPRAGAAEPPTKTGKLEEIFFARKVSQESLGSPHSNPGKLHLTGELDVPSLQSQLISDYKFSSPHHQKTESVGSESSGSLYSGI